MKKRAYSFTDIVTPSHSIRAYAKTGLFHLEIRSGNGKPLTEEMSPTIALLKGMKKLPNDAKISDVATIISWGPKRIFVQVDV